MSTFHDFKVAVSAQFDKLANASVLLEVELNKETLWDTYLGSFPEGTNPIYRERTVHDCNCCKGFIRKIGGVVAFVDGKLQSIWDIDIDDEFKVVAKAMSAYVLSHHPHTRFYTDLPNVGVAQNHEPQEDGSVKTYEHFHQVMPVSIVTNDGARLRGVDRDNAQGLSRSILEINRVDAEQVLELINDNNIYRGAEYKVHVERLLQNMTDYDNASNTEAFIWERSVKQGQSANIRNNPIGALLTNMYKGDDLETAVGKYEAMTAPANFKRSSKIVTEGMVKKAFETVETLGMTDSLSRRRAHLSDLTINNVLFADRVARTHMGVFDSLLTGGKPSKVKTDNLDEMSINEFMEHVVPRCTSIDLMVENRHENCLISLLTAEHPEAPGLFKWNNNFSWAYNGDVTDSIAGRVKAAGGDIDGELRVSLAWENGDDLDLAVKSGAESVSYSNPVSRQLAAKLDVDMNYGSNRNDIDPVENITFTDRSKLNSTFEVKVQNNGQRGDGNTGCTIEIAFQGELYSLRYPQQLTRTKSMCKFTISASGLVFKDTVAPVTTGSAEKTIWDLTTGNFVKVNSMMLSPNFWDGQEVGNKHFFFILDGCKNPEKARGFYNEFLSAELHKDRKVFEVLGSKTKVDMDGDQMSGLGFSSTQRNSVVVKVSGDINKLIKVNF